MLIYLKLIINRKTHNAGFWLIIMGTVVLNLFKHQSDFLIVRLTFKILNTKTLMFYDFLCRELLASLCQSQVKSHWPKLVILNNMEPPHLILKQTTNANATYNPLCVQELRNDHKTFSSPANTKLFWETAKIFNVSNLNVVNHHLVQWNILRYNLNLTRGTHKRKATLYITRSDVTVMTQIIDVIQGQWRYFPFPTCGFGNYDMDHNSCFTKIETTM